MYNIHLISIREMHENQYQVVIYQVLIKNIN